MLHFLFKNRHLEKNKLHYYLVCFHVTLEICRLKTQNSKKLCVTSTLPQTHEK